MDCLNSLGLREGRPRPQSSLREQDAPAPAAAPARRGRSVSREQAARVLELQVPECITPYAPGRRGCLWQQNGTLALPGAAGGTERDPRKAETRRQEERPSKPRTAKQIC